jgi:formylglycine-generating enzyme required for sulfatase activity
MAGSMVDVPAGTFRMGANQLPPGDESPEHAADLSSYRIGKYEVTNADYRHCVDAEACGEPQDLRYFGDAGAAAEPVVFITWYQAVAYCAWLHQRLPTEAEWEKAARGTQGLIYPWGGELDPTKLNAGMRYGRLTPVGSFPSGASPYGALDMAGNAWEWTADWYLPYADSTFHSDLFGQKYKVVRGGSWNHPDEDARTFHRDIANPQRALAVVGFRCAADEEESYQP